MIPNLYPFESVKEALDAFFLERADHLLLQRAYARFKGMVTLLAITEYGMFETKNEGARQKALSFAWEDMDIAFRGYGDNTTTGFVIEIWARLEMKDWAEFKQLLEDILGRARKEAKRRGVTPRYSRRYMHMPVRDLDEDFCLPTAMPLTGPTVRDWAAENDMDPSLVEEAMMYMESRDQLKAKEDAANAAKRARSKFQVLPGEKKD